VTDIDETYDDQVDSWIKTADRIIEKETGRIFEATADFEEKKYDGTGTQSLVVDDILELNKVEEEDGEIEVHEYPANATPKTWLESDSYFRKGKQNIIVSAKWGYSEYPPEDIVFASTMIVAGIINKVYPTSSNIESESIGGYQVSFRSKQEFTDFKRIRETLWMYRRHL